MYKYRNKDFRKMIATIVFQKTILGIKQLHQKCEYEIESLAEKKFGKVIYKSIRLENALYVLFSNLLLNKLTSNLDRNGEVKDYFKGYEHIDIIYYTSLHLGFNHGTQINESIFIIITNKDILEYERERKINQILDNEYSEYDSIDYDILGNTNYINEYKRLTNKERNTFN